MMNPWYIVLALIAVLAGCVCIAYFAVRMRPDEKQMEGDLPLVAPDVYLDLLVEAWPDKPNADPFPEGSGAQENTQLRPWQVHQVELAYPFPEVEIGPAKIENATVSPPIMQDAVEPFPVALVDAPAADPFPEAEQPHAAALPFPEFGPVPIPVGAFSHMIEVGRQMAAADAQPFPEELEAVVIEPFPEGEPVTIEGEPAIELTNASDMVLAFPEESADPTPVPCSPVDGVSYEEIRRMHANALEALTKENERLKSELAGINGKHGAIVKRFLAREKGYETILACVRSYYNAADKRWLTNLKREYLPK